MHANPGDDGTMNSKRPLGETGRAAVLVLLAAVLLVFVGIISFPKPEEIKVPEPPKVFREKPAPPAAAYVEKPLSLPVVKGPQAGAGMMRMPDGSFAPPLNGTVNPPPAQWADPFSPIVGTRRGMEPGAIDWYLHADGTMTTTIMLFRHELGRPDATTIVAHPRKPMTDVEASGSQPAK